jgi:hypothetical protein
MNKDTIKDLAYELSLTPHRDGWTLNDARLKRIEDLLTKLCEEIQHNTTTRRQYPLDIKLDKDQPHGQRTPRPD